MTVNGVQDRVPIRFDRDFGSKDFVQMTDCFDLKDTCRTLYPNQCLYTFRRGSSRSRIDMIYVTSGCNVFDYKQVDTGFSDHELVSSSLEWEADYERGPGIWRNNVKHYSSTDFLEE